MGFGLETKRSKTSVEKPKAKRPLKTYGKSSQDIFEFHGASDGELDSIPRMDLDHKAGKHSINRNLRIAETQSSQVSQVGSVTKRPITSSSGDTGLLNTEPKSLESSTGAKDSSLQLVEPPRSEFRSFERSQSRNMATISDPTPSESATSNVITLTGATFSMTDSWDQVANHTRPSRGGVDEERSQGSSQSVRLLPTSPNEGMKQVDLQPTEEAAPSSSASDVSPSKTTTVETTNQTRKALREHSSHLDGEQLHLQPDSNSPTIVDPVVLLPLYMDTEGGQDELSLSIPDVANTSPLEPAKSSKRKRIINDEPDDELSSDENAIGVPKEHYHPRPSKRRSGGGNEEIIIPADFSKKPEAMAKGKRKTKRHKTTAFQELFPKDEDEDEDEEVRVVPDPRFEIPERKTPKISSKRDQSDAERDDNTEEVGPEAQLEPNDAAKVSGQKKRGRPKKVVTGLSEETVAEVEADHNRDDSETEDCIVSATAKKSRKKTKAKNIPAPTTEEHDHNGRNNEDPPAAEDDVEDIPTNVLSETHGNISPSKLAAKPLPSVSAISPPETPRRSTTPALKGPDKHSPISSGKVAYRVGLSKRARIAPLLRIVRK